MQVLQDLGLSDHVWSDKRKLIAQNLDNLGDQFRPAMRAGWLSYIRRVYKEEDCAANVGIRYGRRRLGGRGLSLRRCWMLRTLMFRNLQ